MLSIGKTRLLMLASAALFLAVALAIRAAAGGAHLLLRRDQTRRTGRAVAVATATAHGNESATR
jgi:hypothetical protein